MILIILVALFIGLPVSIAALSYGYLKLQNHLKLLRIRADFKEKALNVRLFEEHTALVEEVQALTERRRLLLTSDRVEDDATEFPAGVWKGEPIPTARPSRAKWNQIISD